MTKHRIAAPALVGLFLASLCTFPAPVAADACAASGVNAPPACGFACQAGASPIVVADSGGTGTVRGEATCPTTRASCSSAFFCYAWDRAETQAGRGSCAAWADTDATVTCMAGWDSATAALAVGGCRAELFALLDLSFVAVVGVSADRSGGRDSFVWSPVGGCVSVVPGCSDFGYEGGHKGLFCGIGPGFNWVVNIP